MWEDSSASTPGETGITGDLESLVKFEPATTGQRFLNWLVDNLFMRYILDYLTITIVSAVLNTTSPGYLNEDDWGTLLLITYLILVFDYLFYYTICEKAFKGYTLGKLLTGTRAIRQDGAELTFKDAFLRSLSRLVPFEPFSAFGDTPWHDSWTKTRVVRTR